MSQARLGFFTLHPRRKSVNLLLQPGLQLRLPFWLLVATFGFVLLSVVHGYLAYEGIFATLLAEVDAPRSVQDVIRAQTADFVFVSGLIAVAYVLVVLSISIVQTHRMIGPGVALRRQIEALKNGDYAARVHLRKRDALKEVAADLNELAGILERGSKETGSTNP